MPRKHSHWPRCPSIAIVCPGGDPFPKVPILKNAIFLSLAFCLVLLTPGVRAQDAANASATPEEPGGNETVEVAMQAPPPLWRLTRPSNPDSEVWVIGTIDSMPRNLNWNKKAIGDLLDGARAIIMPPQPSVDLVDIGWFLIWHGSEFSLPRGKRLEATLSDSVRAHFIAVRTSLGQDEDRYATDIPLRAVIRLQGDFQNKYKLGGGAGGAIRSLASSKHVPITPAGKFEVMDILRGMLKLPIEKQNVCLADALDDVDRLAQHAEIAARAWAKGDFKTVKAHYAEYRMLDCITAAMQAVANLNEFQTATYVTAINGAFAKPGKTVVTIGIGPLLRDNGVLARLVKQGVVVEAPPE